MSPFRLQSYFKENREYEYNLLPILLKSAQCIKIREGQHYFRFNEFEALLWTMSFGYRDPAWITGYLSNT